MPTRGVSGGGAGRTLAGFDNNALPQRGASGRTMKTRRDFLTQAPLGLLGAMVAGSTLAQTGENPAPTTRCSAEMVNSS